MLVNIRDVIMTIWTHHALRRSAERFPGIDIDEEYRGSRGAGRSKTLKKIREQCKINGRIYATKKFNGVYYLISKSDIVFVMTKPEKVITVFKLIR